MVLVKIFSSSFLKKNSSREVSSKQSQSGKNFIDIITYKNSLNNTQTNYWESISIRSSEFFIQNKFFPKLFRCGLHQDSQEQLKQLSEIRGLFFLCCN